MATDWYRRKSWSKTDEEEFFAKLSRARKDGRAQYLKIQAIELVDTKKPKLLQVAKELLSKVLNEYPDDNFNKASVYHTFGDIFQLENNIEKALEYYKNAIDFEKVYPNVITQSYLDYSEIVVKNQLEDLYPIAEEILESKTSGLLFPIEKYKVFSLLAIINGHNSNIEIAKKYSELANENANKTTSGLSYHKHLGIVSERDNLLEKLTKKFL
ncbi:hypothetical protein OD917_19300 [Flavobacterium sp. SH_e]|uniref:hypothetical protein n=1 Tax=Flavobacterium TaxID=237 RepID=UPI0021E3FFF5|nr:hypothetical protein [Flavobacterium sp. SH_e]MCV2487087.1 hypothetical protein [Flavobacterium sp. SH_e]